LEGEILKKLFARIWKKRLVIILVIGLYFFAKFLLTGNEGFLLSSAFFLVIFDIFVYA